MTTLPPANYVFVTSRLHPGRDGGYTVSVLRRAAQFRRFGGAEPVLLTVDLAASYDEHRAGFRELGLADDSTVLRNLFEEAVADPAWVFAAADPSITASTTEFDDHADGSGILTLRTPRVPRPDWHRTEAPLLVLREGEVVGGFAGFGGLYRAWLHRVIGGMDASLPTVLIAESRQIGEHLSALRQEGVVVVHTVHNAHTLPPHEWDSPIDGMWAGWLEGLEGYDAVAFLTHSQRDDVVRRFGEPTRLEVIPHALDGGAVRGADPHLVAMITSLIPRKRVDHVIRAVADLQSRLPVRLDVFGDGPERSRLEALAAELGADSAVRLLGYVPDAAVRVSGAAVSVLSSTYEGQPLAVLESLMQGVPVVAYDINYGPRDMIVHGENGLLVAPGDVDGLTDALGQVLGDPALRARLASGARATADRLGPAAVMRRWATLVAELLPD